jgi:two-component system, cell cycle response regulator DivK
MQQETYNWSGEKILVADDDSYSYLLLARVLKKTGAKLIFAGDGEEALVKLKDDNKITVAILDIIMPKIDGAEVVRRIKKIRPDLICIAYTADVVRFDSQKCKECGFSACISKPVLPARFLRILDETLMLRSQLL